LRMDRKWPRHGRAGSYLDEVAPSQRLPPRLRVAIVAIQIGARKGANVGG
jgi:hypothetical protein